MPRVSSAPEDAYHFKGSFEEGWGVVTAAEAVVFQFPPTKEAKNGRPAGSQDPPQLMARLEIQRMVDGDGNKNPAPTEEVLLPIQKPDKGTGELSACHPGNFPDANPEADPEDMGGELGASGNTLYAMQDGYAINEKCKWMRFTSSLQAKGFKPAILKRTFFTDLVGLYAFFKNETVKGGSPEFDGTAFVVDKIVRFPYEKGAADAAKPTAKVKASTGSKPVAAAATKPVSDAPESNGASGGTDPQEIALAVLTDTLAPSKKGQTLKDMPKLKLEALMASNKHKPAIPAEIKKQVLDQFKDEDWIRAVGESTELFAFAADGSVTFAA
jgi:hypothetical protein